MNQLVPIVFISAIDESLTLAELLGWSRAAAGVVQGSDGVRRILDIRPEALHQRLPLFLGSRDDIAELCSYGDVQQTGKQKYDV